MFDLEETVMGIIINAGQARSLCYEALHCAKKGQFSEADDLLRQANEATREAHAVQTRLIEADQGTGQIQVSLVLVHAQDHLMTSMLAKELVCELIELYRRQAA
ncbi:PTS system, cellobiose-specific IIA component [Aeromonas sp. RU39B]|jgi:PTS system cellobiose-specific IIA component|uniref:PTS N,N'-diacetylchitobiose transporter subunit IIA n=1 Tax=Aeromonas sp. RU39B TaxID=1907416 RepID=UPI0009548FA3|nr:PTS N,N'-diacetylchitobiose transporter subunit IIA [Aeromonas sp. RU39B]SIQ40598.1 PTS system, cellobiose-specific IIA component [Aeromonas sp. RU39B]